MSNLLIYRHFHLLLRIKPMIEITDCVCNKRRQLYVTATSKRTVSKHTKLDTVIRSFGLFNKAIGLNNHFYFKHYLWVHIFEIFD